MRDQSLSLLSAVIEAKRAAFELKKTERLPHSEALNRTAREMFGAQSFHELRARYRNHIDSIPHINDGVGRCPACHLTFSTIDRDDVKAHRERHQSFDEAAIALGLRPRGYQELERLKGRAYSRMREAPEGSKEVAECWEQVFLAWFERSLNSSIDGGDWRHHPDFETYCGMLLGTGDHDRLACLPHLEQRFGRERGQIIAGSNYWVPPKAKRRLEHRV
jgi:hypothetical protein